MVSKVFCIVCVCISVNSDSRFLDCYYDCFISHLILFCIFIVVQIGWYFIDVLFQWFHFMNVFVKCYSSECCLALLRRWQVKNIHIWRRDFNLRRKRVMSRESIFSYIAFQTRRVSPVIWFLTPVENPEFLNKKECRLYRLSFIVNEK